MSERPFSHSPGHARHDRLLVARFAFGETVAAEAADGRRLVEQCSECARLADDLRLLRSSIAALPTPRRTRNFRLTQAQAEALRGNFLDRLLRRLAAPGLTMLRPVAGVALAMGLTVAVVGAGLPMAASAPAAAPAPTQAGSEFDSLNADAGTPLAPASEPYPAAMETPGDGPKGSATGDSTAVGGGGRSSDTATPTASPPPIAVAPTVTPTEPPSIRLLLIYGGVTLAMLSFAMLLLAWFARRRLEDPLLR